MTVALGSGGCRGEPQEKREKGFGASGRFRFRARRSRSGLTAAAETQSPLTGDSRPATELWAPARPRET